MEQNLPVVVIGAGPVGLAAAAQLLARGLTPLVLERGAGVGASLRDWAHVRVFTPWRYNIDAAARDLLINSGWQEPDPEALPDGAALVRDYLEPLARLPAVAPHVRCQAEVVAVSRLGFDKLTSTGRESAPFLVRWRGPAGSEEQVVARAVIDASGSWRQPNPMGVDGLPVPGEAEAADHIAYGIPDVAGAEISDYEGRHILVVGSGHSAINVVLDLLRLKDEAPTTRVFWALRRSGLAKIVGGGADDRLAERGTLGLAARRAIDEGHLELLVPFAAERISRHEGALKVAARVAGNPVTLDLDRIVVATGFRPDLSLFRELRVALDPIVEAPLALAPLIDPNLHSCGTVPPHGAAELAQPEPGFYIVGSKSYGRAPTFLMMTGYEQVRSVAAAIAGDHAAARDVRLVLPETGVCSTSIGAEETSATGCCTPTRQAEPAVPTSSCCGPRA